MKHSRFFVNFGGVDLNIESGLWNCPRNLFPRTHHVCRLGPLRPNGQAHRNRAGWHLQGRRGSPQGSEDVEYAVSRSSSNDPKNRSFRLTSHWNDAPASGSCSVGQGSGWFFNENGGVYFRLVDRDVRRRRCFKPGTVLARCSRSKKRSGSRPASRISLRSDEDSSASAISMTARRRPVRIRWARCPLATNPTHFQSIRKCRD